MPTVSVGIGYTASPENMTRNYNSKKLRAVFLAALMFLWVFAGTMAFAGGAAAQAASGDRTVVDTAQPGETITVTVDIQNPPDESISIVDVVEDGSGNAIGQAAFNVVDPAGDNPFTDDTFHVLSNGEVIASYDRSDVTDPTTLEYELDISETSLSAGDTIEFSSEASSVAAAGTDTVTIEEPEAGPFNVTNLSPTDPTVAPGDQLTITADVTNTGPAEGATEVRAIVAGTEVANETETIGAGDTTTVSFDVTAPDTTGKYTHSVETDDDSQSGTLTASNDPEFTITGLSPQEPTVGQGDTIDISAQIENTGGSGTQTVSLLVDGTVINEATVQLDNEGTTSILFSDVATAQLTPGTYTHDVNTANDTASGTLTIEASVTTYETAPGTVEVGGLVDAISDWRNGETDVGLLLDVIDAWRQS